MTIILETKDLVYRYPSKTKNQHIVPFSFQLEKGRSLGVVGESGSGKTSLSRLLCRFLSPHKGQAYLEGLSYDKWSQREFYKKIQYIDQHPYASFHPRRSIASSLMEVCENYHPNLSQDEKIAKVDAALKSVKLSREVINHRPASISGGECQRAAIARALLVEPQILVCDEITSALDMTIQAEIIEVLEALKASYQMTFIFISHDLALVSQFCNQILVLKDGKVKEQGDMRAVLTSPQHSYTAQLVDYYQTEEEI